MLRSRDFIVASMCGFLFVYSGLMISAEPKTGEPSPAATSIRIAILSRTFFEGRKASGDEVLCAMMDVHVGSGTATLAAFSDGTVSLYFDKGGGMIGLGGKKAVRAAAERFLDRASEARELFRPRSEFPFPEAGQATFYLVTADSTYSSVSFRPEAAGDQDHPFHKLFESADRTLTEIRQSQGE